jgi:nucleotide-binding universal stress UspA family protein
MKILLGLDGSRYSAAAVQFVCQNLAPARAQVDIVHILPLIVRPDAAAPRRQREDMRIPAATRLWLERHEKRLQSRGLKVSRLVRRGTPTKLLPELATKGEYDIVVVGAKGRSETPFLPSGSVALSVLEHAPSSVLLVRAPKLKGGEEASGLPEPAPVIFAADGSRYSTEAAKTFFRSFEIPQLRPIAIAVAEMPEPPVLWQMKASWREKIIGQIGDAARRWAGEMKSELARPGIAPQARVIRGRPAPAIVAEAVRQHAQLIVLGSRGANDYWGPRLGSVALQIARAAPCSVLVVRKR